MVFPDYYFFAERYLVNHTIEKKRVNNLDDCELMCYLNDDWNDFLFTLNVRRLSMAKLEQFICMSNA